jgi:Arc/MetJ family transcription regulator
MATNLQLDDRLIDEAVRLGEHKSKKDAVTQALIEYTQRLRQLDLLDLFGTIDYDDDWDYKAQRRVS